MSVVLFAMICNLDFGKHWVYCNDLNAVLSNKSGDVPNCADACFS